MCWLKMFLCGSYFVADFCVVSLLCGGCKVLWVVSSCFLPGSNRHFSPWLADNPFAILQLQNLSFWVFVIHLEGDCTLQSSCGWYSPLMHLLQLSAWGTRTLKVAYTVPKNRRPPEVCTLIELKYCTKKCTRLLHLPFEIVCLRLTLARQPCGASM